MFSVAVIKTHYLDRGKKVKGHEEPWSGNLQINDEGKITEIT